MDDPLYEKYRREHPFKTVVDKRLINELLGYIYPYRFAVIISITLLIIAKAIEATVPIFIGYTAQEIVSSPRGETNEPLFNQILWSCLVLIGLLVMTYILELISMILKNWAGQKALVTIRTRVFDHIQRLPISYFNQNPIGRLLTRTIHDIDQIGQLFIESLIPLFGNFVLFLSMLIGIAWINWQIALAFSLILPFVAWLTNRFRKNQRRCYDLLRNIIAAMNTFVHEHLLGASIIRNFGLQKQEKRHFDVLNEDFRIGNIRTIHHFAYFIAGIDLFQNISLISAFVILVLLAPPNAEFQVGTFFTFTLYSVMFFRPLVDLAERYNILESALSAAARVSHILQEPSEPKEQPTEQTIDEITSIEFDDVWFAYTNEEWVLKGVSFSLEKGESLAFVGVTGVGKTTILSLLLRFFDHHKGSIKINGKDIRSYPLHAVRRKFSVVLQDPVIFSGTIQDNIALFGKEVNQDRIDSTIEYLGMQAVMAKYTDGIKHRLQVGGKGLSAGEMQLLSLARAVAHERSVLVLDEATANIDAMTEKMIQRALNKMLQDRTALIVAHRLSTIRHATRIIVLHQGVVAEQGSHDELLARKGLYEKLYRIQFAS